MQPEQTRIPLIVFMTMSAVLPLGLRAQANGPQFPGLTQGATHESRTSDVPGLTTATSLCPMSDDPTYGVTPANPIKVGGGPMYVKARSIRFLHTLRGPAGQGLHLKRLGSFGGPDETILDVYLVAHDGIVRHIYVDGYRWAAPKAPLGLPCGITLHLDPPTPDPFETERQRIALAARLDPTMAGPISLDPDGSATHGVVFDHVRLVGRAFAAAARSGQLLDLEHLPREVSRPHFVVVAYPARCDDREPIPPRSVTISDANGNSPRVMKEARGEQIQDLVAGFDVPPSALAIVYDADLAIPGRIEIAYGEGCGTTPLTVAFPIKGEAGRITRRLGGLVPAGTTLPPGGAQVRVQVYFDFNGTPHFPAYAGGLATLADAAVTAASEFRADPPRVNGAPILQVSTISVVFQQ